MKPLASTIDISEFDECTVSFFIQFDWILQNLTLRNSENATSTFLSHFLMWIFLWNWVRGDESILRSDDAMELLEC